MPLAPHDIPVKSYLIGSLLNKASFNLIIGFNQYWAEPTELLLAIGLTCLAIQNGKRGLRALMLFYPAIWLTGSLIGSYLPPILYLSIVTIPGLEIIDKNPSAILAASVLMTGLLVALGRQFNLRLYLIFILVVGLVTGFLHGLLVNGHPNGIFATLGMLTMLWLTLFIAIFIFSFLSQLRQGIVLRVIGSWIAAAGILVLGYSIKHNL